jgi:7,8-dihydropterin-6-yl-methyl-4-(beta-D-ribofuranosyl)aminobenzene 5'-phosphate synthase
MTTIHVLVDNRDGEHLQGEHGLSLLIESDAKILFDTGQSDLFKRNASHMGLTLSDISFLALSHGHWDHGNGMKHLQSVNVVAHPHCFTKRYSKIDGTYCGLDSDQAFIEQVHALTLTDDPLWLTPRTVFLGEIPRITSFESKTSSFLTENHQIDLIPDDSAIAIRSGRGITIVTGCSHSGIGNIAAHALNVTGAEKIHAIIGGFHLGDLDEKTDLTIKTLLQLGVDTVYPMHCTAPAVVEALGRKFSLHQPKTGDTFQM